MSHNHPDSYQQKAICGSNCLGTKPSPAFQAYGESLVRKLRATVLQKPGNGAFVDSCLHHCGGSGTYRNSNMTQAQALKVLCP